MPAKKGGRKGGKMPTVAKAKKQMANKKKSQAQKNKDTFFLRANMTATITPSQGAVVNNYISWFPQLLNATSPWSVTNNADFRFWSKVYDQVRVNSIHLRVVPKANVLDQQGAQNDAQYTVTGDGLIHTCIDRDNQPPASVSSLQRYSSYRKHSVLKPFSRSYSITYPSEVWLDTNNIFEDETLLRRLGAYGGVYFYAENLLEDILEALNEPWATIHISYNCVFRGKVMAALTFNDDGTITVKSHDDTARPDDSQVTILSGAVNSTRVDISGNTVPVTDEDLP